ncbi:MAG: carboxypeptidase-like regulatory domain-containing protein [Chloroflexota bacterium]
MLRILTRATGVVAVLLALATAFPAHVTEAAVSVCRAFRATSEVAWYSSDEEPNVDFYPSGVAGIQPYFEYSCAPRNTTIVTIFTLDGEEVFADEETLQPSSSSDIYTYPLTAKSGVMPDGEWGVTFLVNDVPVVSGQITVGGEATDTVADVVEVTGTVTDKRTRKPIRGALFVVLYPGVTIEQFADEDFNEELIYTSAVTDARGRFALEEPLERNVEYSVLVAAKGYKPVAQDGFVITDEDEDPVVLNVTMVK